MFYQGRTGLLVTVGGLGLSGDREVTLRTRSLHQSPRPLVLLPPPLPSLLLLGERKEKKTKNREKEEGNGGREKGENKEF